MFCPKIDTVLAATLAWQEVVAAQNYCYHECQFLQYRRSKTCLVIREILLLEVVLEKI